MEIGKLNFKTALSVRGCFCLTVYFLFALFAVLNYTFQSKERTLKTKGGNDMIEFSNGYRFEYMAASGTVRFGEGWLIDRMLTKMGLLDLSVLDVAVTKTVTRYPKEGNYDWYKPWTSIHPIKNGIVNAVGLTNPGIEWWCREIGPKINSSKIPLIGSIFSDDVNELGEMAIMFNDFDFVGIELNESCPSICGNHLQSAKKVVEDCKMAHRNSCHPIILKLSVIHPIEVIIPRIKGMVEAISINSVPWSIAFNKKSPLAHFGGGVSGKAAQPHTWRLAEKLVEITDIPVIGPSVWEFSDIEKLEKLGAKAFSFGSIFFYPWRLRRILKAIKKNRTLI